MGAQRKQMRVGAAISLAALAACGSSKGQAPPPVDGGSPGFHCQEIPTGGFPLDGGIIVTTVMSNIGISGASLAVDSQGDLFAADPAWEFVIELKPSGLAAYLWDANPNPEPDGWPDAGVIQLVDGPAGVAVEGNGAIVVTAYFSHQVFRIDSSGAVTGVAGNGKEGFQDGPASAAEFAGPNGVVVDAAGNAYVSDNGERLRKVDPDGNVTTVAGGATLGFADGPGTTAQFNGLENLAIGQQGLIYAADTFNNRIRVIDVNGNVTTFAGNGSAGYLDGPAASAEFNLPEGVALDQVGNVYVADTGNGRVRKIDTVGNVTTIAGNGAACATDGTGGPNGTATLAGPDDIAVMPNGDIYSCELSSPLQVIHFAQ
jgi:sugar lactone lactonase YvrE